MANRAACRQSAKDRLRNLQPRLQMLVGLTFAVVAMLTVLRCSRYDKEGRLRGQPTARTADSLRPQAAERQRDSVSAEARAQIERLVKSNASRYKPELFTKITIVSDTDIAPRPLSLPRDRWFEMAYSCGIEASATVSALVDTKGNVKDVVLRVPSAWARYDSAVIRSVRASLFSPLHSEGLRVEAWVRLRYESKFGPDSPPLYVIPRP